MSPYHDVVEFFSVTRRVCRKSGIRCIASSRFNQAVRSIQVEINTGTEQSLGSFQFNEKFLFDFRNFQPQMEQHLPEFPVKRTTLRGVPKFTESFNRKFVLHVTFFPQFPEVSVGWFSFWKNLTISRFSENFPRIFPFHLSPYRHFWNFLLNEKRPMATIVLHEEIGSSTVVEM